MVQRCRDLFGPMIQAIVALSSSFRGRLLSGCDPIRLRKRISFGDAIVRNNISNLKEGKTEDYRPEKKRICGDSAFGVIVFGQVSSHLNRFKKWWLGYIKDLLTTRFRSLSIIIKWLRLVTKYLSLSSKPDSEYEIMTNERT